MYITNTSLNTIVLQKHTRIILTPCEYNCTPLVSINSVLALERLTTLVSTLFSNSLTNYIRKYLYFVVFLFWKRVQLMFTCWFTRYIYKVIEVFSRQSHLVVFTSTRKWETMDYVRHICNRSQAATITICCTAKTARFLFLACNEHRILTIKGTRCT
jgi:hypothetical protein